MNLRHDNKNKQHLTLVQGFHLVEFSLSFKDFSFSFSCPPFSLCVCVCNSFVHSIIIKLDILWRSEKKKNLPNFAHMRYATLMGFVCFERNCLRSVRQFCLKINCISRCSRCVYCWYRYFWHLHSLHLANVFGHLDNCKSSRSDQLESAACHKYFQMRNGWSFVNRNTGCTKKKNLYKQKQIYLNI